MKKIKLILFLVFVPTILWSQNIFDYVDNQKIQAIGQQSKIIHIILSINGEIIPNYDLGYRDSALIKPNFQLPGGFYMNPDDWETFENNSSDIQLTCKYKYYDIKIPIKRIFMKNLFFIVYVSTNDLKENKKLFKAYERKRFGYMVKIYSGNIQSIREIYYLSE